MKTLKVLDWPAYRFYSDSHPLHKWSRKLREHDIKVEFYSDHKSPKLHGADYLFIHSRYFENGWQDTYKRNDENENDLVNYLSWMKAKVGKLIWFDAADSTGSSDFPIINLVDAFVKKQLHKDLTYYTNKTNAGLRVWLNNESKQHQITFEPCPAGDLHKLKLGWNIGLNDYRYYGYKMSRLSNYLSYKLYPSRFQSVDSGRKFDLTFRGTIHKDQGYGLSNQRNKVLSLLNSLNRNVVSGKPVAKKQYLQELKSSKVSISPYGWGEVCYRDFETLISGALLIKPAMEHLDTYPNVYIPGETYLPVLWSLNDLEEKLEYALSNYQSLKLIAENGQQVYKKAVNDGDAFVEIIKNIVG